MLARVTWVLLWAALVVGCFNPTYQDQGFRCDKTRACPEGYNCLFNGQNYVCTTQSTLPDGGTDAQQGVVEVGGWRMVFGPPTHDCDNKEFIQLSQSVFYVEQASDTDAVVLRGGRVTCPFAGGRLSCPSIDNVASRIKGGEIKYRSTLALEPTSKTTGTVDFTETFTSCTGPECPTGYPCTVQYTGTAERLPDKNVPSASCSVVGIEPPGTEHALVLVVNRGTVRKVVYRFNSQKESLVKSLGAGDNVLIVDADKSYIVIRDEQKTCLEAYPLSKDVFNIITLTD
ncbi:MAG: hypothetical protein KC503_41535 [Myxococcales bacterium]|nr:hypothetical protein [Myxococcales bacterium]